MTKKEMQSMVERVNISLKTKNSPYSIEASSRNGYIGLDWYKGNTMIKMLHSGTAKDVYTFARGMAQVLENDLNA